MDRRSGPGGRELKRQSGVAQQYLGEGTFISGESNTGSKAAGGPEPGGAKKVEQVSATTNSSDAPARDAPEDPYSHNKRHALHNSYDQVFAVMHPTRVVVYTGQTAGGRIAG